MIHRDPGRDWIESALAPLRRATADVDVAPGIMARVLAEGSGARRLPAAFPSGRLRLAWAACLLAGVVALSLLVGALYGRGASRGPEGALPILAALGRAGILLGHAVSRFASTMLAAAAPVLRGVWVLIEAAAPLFRGAGLIAATGGLLSILVSLIIFAQARRSAPLAGTQGGIR